MTVKAAIQFGHNALKETSGSPLTDAKVLLQHVLQIDRTELQRRLNQILTDGQFRDFQGHLSQRQKSEPIAYITGHKEFYGIDFYVDRRVLIPRPETEQLVDAVLRELEGRGVEPTLVIDVGTGSGNIACTVARLRPTQRVIATDVSKGAILVATRNARTIEVERQIDFRIGPLLGPITSEELTGPVVMAANLPYVPARYQVMLDLDFEPKEAIFPGDDDGLALYADFFRELGQKAPADLVLFIEIHHDQAKAIDAIVRRALPGAKLETLSDYSGHDRIVRIENRALLGG